MMSILKERIIALVDGCNLPYVIPLLSDLENAIHEHSFDNGYDFGCVGMMMGGRND